MGHWNMTVVGCGIHDNGLAEDADRLFAEFVKKLEEAGHELYHVSFIRGSVTIFDNKSEKVNKV